MTLALTVVDFFFFFLPNRELSFAFGSAMSSVARRYLWLARVMYWTPSADINLNGGAVLSIIAPTTYETSINIISHRKTLWTSECLVSTDTSCADVASPCCSIVVTNSVVLNAISVRPTRHPCGGNDATLASPNIILQYGILRVQLSKAWAGVFIEHTNSRCNFTPPSIRVTDRSGG
ncbi:hypothetical protein GQ600_18067 [Phytophthora cactorum]|nr:hypothetical protein GQ600_18067 [Phytophthora cactorum]